MVRPYIIPLTVNPIIAQGPHACIYNAWFLVALHSAVNKCDSPKSMLVF